MKIIAISDTHNNFGKIKSIKYKEADFLIIAGDYTNIGMKIEHKEFLDKISSFTHIKNKIVVLGNHDGRNLHNKSGLNEENIYNWCKEQYSDIIFLNNEIIELEGLKIYGTAWNKGYKGLWAFEYNNDNVKNLTLPKEEVDIIITHEPPSSFELSYAPEYGDLGNIHLYNYLEDNKCRLLICGHIHENSGNSCYINECYCVNVAEKLTELSI